jgi:hypothetical protein
VADKSLPSGAPKEFPDAFRLHTCLSLTAFREEWEEAVRPESLMKIPVNLGQILIDLVERLGLDEHAKAAILGARLYRELRKRRSNHHR